MAEDQVATIPKDNESEGSGGDWSGLALLWDNLSLVRQRFRDGHNLVLHYDSKLKRLTDHAVEKTTQNVKMNSVVLTPVCNLTRRSGSLPNIEKLVQEVKFVFRLNQVIIDTPTAYNQGWAIRRLMQVLKGSVKTRFVRKHGSAEKERTYTWPKDQSYKPHQAILTQPSKVSIPTFFSSLSF